MKPITLRTPWIYTHSGEWCVRLGTQERRLCDEGVRDLFNIPDSLRWHGRVRFVITQEMYFRDGETDHHCRIIPTRHFDREDLLVQVASDKGEYLWYDVETASLLRWWLQPRLVELKMTNKTTYWHLSCEIEELD